MITDNVFTEMDGSMKKAASCHRFVITKSKTRRYDRTAQKYNNILIRKELHVVKVWFMTNEQVLMSNTQDVYGAPTVPPESQILSCALNVTDTGRCIRCKAKTVADVFADLLKVPMSFLYLLQSLNIESCPYLHTG